MQSKFATFFSHAEDFIKKIFAEPITFRGWVAGFLGIIFVRSFLESLSSPVFFTVGLRDIVTLVHYLLFFLGIGLSFALVIRIFVKDGKEIVRLSLFGYLITFIPPIFDLIISRGTGISMNYIYGSAPALLKNFLSFTSYQSFGQFSGSTPGIRLEIFLLLMGIACYVFYKTGSVLKGAVAAFFAYTAGFIWGAAPSVIHIVASLFGFGSRETIAGFLFNSIRASFIGNNFLRFANEGLLLQNVFLLTQVALAQIFYIAVFILLALWFFINEKGKFIATFKNSRPSRALHYYLMIGLGIAIGIHLLHPIVAWNWVDVVSTIVLFLSFFSAGMFSIGVNDIVDLPIDRISSKNRPLVTGALTVEDTKNLNIFFLIWALVGGYLLGYYQFFMAVVFMAAYYIYSSTPLRLKRVPILSTFLISIASLSAAVAGFYLVGVGGNVPFPFAYTVTIVLGLTLAANIKDIKDIEGDQTLHISTIPVIFGERTGKQIVGVLAGLAFLVLPLVLDRVLLFPSLIAAALIYFLVTKKHYKEWPIFTLYFFYALVAVLLLR